MAQADEFNLKPVAREAESSMNPSIAMGNRSGHPLLRCQALYHFHFGSNDVTSSKTPATHYK